MTDAGGRRRRVVPIVEGHGEDRAVRTLLDRVWREELGRQDWIEVLRPIRRPRNRLVVAAAASLGEFLDLADTQPVGDPEARGMGKGWIQARFKGAKYSETIDQLRLTAAMDLGLCRRRSPSVAKLCRELNRIAG